MIPEDWELNAEEWSKLPWDYYATADAAAAKAARKALRWAVKACEELHCGGHDPEGDTAIEGCLSALNAKLRELEDEDE